MNEVEQLKRVLRGVAELRAELERLRNSPMAPSQTSALPESVHDHLHQLDMTAGPSEDQAMLESARDTTEVLTRLNVELRKSLNVWLGPVADA